MQTRAGGKSRRLTLGRHGLISADQARREVARIMADIKAGREPVFDNGSTPADAGPTIAEVAERDMREQADVFASVAPGEGPPRWVAGSFHAASRPVPRDRREGANGRFAALGDAECLQPRGEQGE